MSLILGIDTGGTFTDAVIINPETKEIIAEAKSETTHFHLEDGITSVINLLDFNSYNKIAYASLSTTLATNAIVEGRGCRVGLILMGFEPQKDLPRCELRCIPGAVDLHGKITEPVDCEKTEEAIESLRGKVDAVAVSSILSIRNPELEEQVKGMVRDILGLPCVSAHELSSVLGMQERTVTAVLNARLLSVIDDLISAVKSALSKKSLNIPIMIVKGDGSLMTETTAKYRPIETILSGPAASIIGATYLNNIENGLVLDMGGTTTDIAVMKNGRPRIDARGASVGGWLTRVAAAEVNTFGLGGDSRIFLDALDCKKKIGPSRVYPVSTIARDYPQYLEELVEISGERVGMLRYELCEGFVKLSELKKGTEITTLQSRVLRELRDGAHTIFDISRKLSIDSDFIHMEELIKQGVVALVGFTPTDLLHAEGKLNGGSVRAAVLARQLLARRWDTTEEDVSDIIRNKITDSLSMTILNSVFSYEKIPDDAKNTSQLEIMIDKSFHDDGNILLSLPLNLNVPVIGIGAPIRAWLDPAVKRFHTDVIYPQYHHVANAVGAAAGKVMHIYRISVQNHEIDGIHIYFPWGRFAFGAELDSSHTVNEITSDQSHIGHQYKSNTVQAEMAIQYAIRKGKDHMLEELSNTADGEFDILVERKDITTHHGYDENIKMFLESTIEIIAVLQPEWEIEL